MQGASISALEITGVVKYARTIDNPGSPFIFAGLDDGTFFFGDFLVLPQVLGQFLGPGHDASLIIGVAEMCSEGAAASIRS
jgi:hypothetical protein